MSRGVTLPVAIAIGALMVGAAPVEAGTPPQEDSAEEPAPEPSDDGTFTREVTGEDEVVPGGDGSSDEGGATSEEPVIVRCSWYAPSSSETQADSLNTALGVVEDIVEIVTSTSFAIDLTFFVDRGTLRRWNGYDNVFEQRQLANCAGANEPGVATGDERWQEVVPPTPDILIPGLRLLVTGRIDPPASEISPPERAPANLGLWLAVDDPGPIVAEGRLGPLWARGTATLTGTAFDPGNGTPPIACPGGGTPIVDPDTVEEGPCGYTYRSLDDVDDDDLEITITSTWTIVWETSDANASADPPETMPRTAAIPYDVYEIQTVGNGG